MEQPKPGNTENEFQECMDIIHGNPKDNAALLKVAGLAVEQFKEYMFNTITSLREIMSDTTINNDAKVSKVKMFLLNNAKPVEKKDPSEYGIELNIEKCGMKAVSNFASIIKKLNENGKTLTPFIKVATNSELTNDQKVERLTDELLLIMF